jgi:hypothetical protein
MVRNDITCAAGGSLIVAPTGLTVVDDSVGQPMATVPRSRGWRVETAAPDWFDFRCQSSGQVLAVCGQDDASVILTVATHGTRHYWRIIPYPERRSAVIISRVTGLALTAGSPTEGRSAPVGLTAYHGAVSQHWSFTDHQGGTDAIQPES